MLLEDESLVDTRLVLKEGGNSLPLAGSRSGIQEGTSRTVWVSSFALGGKNSKQEM